MSDVFMFTIPSSSKCNIFKEALISAKHMSLLKLPNDTSRYIIRNSKYIPDDNTKEIADILELDMSTNSIDIKDMPVQASSKDYGSYPMTMLKSGIDYLENNNISVDIIYSVPACWVCTMPISLISSTKLVKHRTDVFSIVLGGNPISHLDRGAQFDLVKSKVPGYLKLRAQTWDYNGLDCLCCPSIINVNNFKRLFLEEHRSLTNITRAGWSDNYMVLYPESLTASPTDGKPEPFKDIVGIYPEWWNKYECEYTTNSLED